MSRCAEADGIFCSDAEGQVVLRYRVGYIFRYGVVAVVLHCNRHGDGAVCVRLIVFVTSVGSRTCRLSNPSDCSGAVVGRSSDGSSFQARYRVLTVASVYDSRKGDVTNDGLGIVAAAYALCLGHAVCAAVADGESAGGGPAAVVAGDGIFMRHRHSAAVGIESCYVVVGSQEGVEVGGAFAAFLGGGVARPRAGQLRILGVASGEGLRLRD